eukprot:TRINITY_DN44039_c0_g1_i1.p1 TRINITY_DN44039_c0_g1~~TRINITY_DN44039_c0_g1_i1.p1  ORF type:complete len:392 (+),score=56.49 TRINITY_DN44039_c0_g1_i1:149-1324(+)
MLRHTQRPRSEENTRGDSTASSSRASGMSTSSKKKNFCETVVVVLSWFFLNIAMGSSTKWIFVHAKLCKKPDLDLLGWQKDEECKTFKYPVVITVIHMLFSWCMCYIHIFYIRGGPTSALMSYREQVVKIAPLASCFALSVAMGNLSLKYIYPSFNQMLGAMSPLITVMLAVILERKRYNFYTWASMPIICGGLVVCSINEVNFHFFGAIFCVGATVLRAVKSIIQGRLLTQKLDSVTLLFYMAPWSAMMLGVAAIFLDGTEPLVILTQATSGEVDGLPYVCLLLAVSGMNACLLNVANFLVTAYTNAVTLQVLGNVKSCLSIAVSVAIFRNPLLPEQGVGVFACLFGVWIYNQRGGTVTEGIVSSIEMANDSKEPPRKPDVGAKSSSTSQ